MKLALIYCMVLSSSLMSGQPYVTSMLSKRSLSHATHSNHIIRLFQSHRHLAAFGRSLTHNLEHSYPRYTRPMLSSQRFTLSGTTSMQMSSTDTDNALLDPYDILRNLQPRNPASTQIIPLPAHLSPSSLDLFNKCPQAFFFQYILKLTPDPPTTPALTRGTCCHTALEEVFDLKPPERSLDNLKHLFRRAWKKKRGTREGNGNGEDENNGYDKAAKSNDYDCLFRTPDGQAYDINAEIEWGKTSLKLLENYYEMEDPRSITPPNPIMREMWVHARFDVDNQPFVIRGIIDRIDMFVDEQSGKIQLQIIDYKTGKKPHFKYSQPVNERIEGEQFVNMRLYTLMLWKMILETEKSVATLYDTSVDDGTNSEIRKPEYKYRLPWELQQKVLRALGKDDESSKLHWSGVLEFLPLRLFFLTSHPDDESVNISLGMDNDTNMGKASFLDAALKPNFHQILHETEQELLSICSNIKDLVEMQDPMAFEHCNRPFCNCHEMRSRFRYGTVWSSK